MRHVVFPIVLVVALWSGAFVALTQAQDAAASEQSDEKPSIFSYGWSCMFSGALVGLGGGYLVGRQDGWRRSDWRAVGLGAGIGALAGAGLGISLGFVDRGGLSVGHYIARDLSAGTGFGLVVGAISGGISAALKHEPEHVLFGAAIGVTAGAGLGILTGIIEGVMRDRRAAKARSTRLWPTVSTLQVADGSRAWFPGLRGSF